MYSHKTYLRVYIECIVSNQMKRFRMHCCVQFRNHLLHQNSSVFLVTFRINIALFTGECKWDKNRFSVLILYQASLFSISLFHSLPPLIFFFLYFPFILWCTMFQLPHHAHIVFTQKNYRHIVQSLKKLLLLYSVFCKFPLTHFISYVYLLNTVK